MFGAKGTSREAVRFQAVILLLLVYCLLLPPIGLWEFCVWSLFCCVVLSVVSSCAIISLGKRELVALL